MMQYGRRNRSLIKRIGPVAWAGALGLVALTSLTPGIARAEDDPSSFWTFDKNFLGGMFSGLGPRHRVDGPYEYRERSPLVVPPSRALPPPQSSEASRPANWPVDPEVNRHQEVAAKRAKGGQAEFEYDPLPPSALAGSAGARASAAGTQNPSGGGGDMTDTLRPSQLGSSSGIFGFFTGANVQQDHQVSADTSEPPPRRMTEPPRDYQVPSPNQPYGAPASTGFGKPTKAADLPVGKNEGL
jgi:hypothetical protein